ncbi:uncharacterized protein [Scyliorhinus torazame]|uniref:uncharacterized protein n=1 Tax=Scyliorhinus torazame TaxID=75743 RepID=UPI003B5B48B7
MSFNHNFHLVSHQKIPTGEKPFTCELCDKSFTRSSSLSEHQRLHTGEKPFKCAVCEMTFNRNCNLQSHQRIHTGEKPFTCEVCDKSFTRSTNLSKHKRLHIGEKPFTCDVCAMTFNQNYHLLIHQRIHTVEKPFKCEVRDKSFSESSILRQHRRTHTREKPFKCDFCVKVFNQSSHLQAHQRIHTGEIPFPCKVKLAYNTQEHSLTGEQVPYIKELTEQEEFTRKLFGLPNPTITNGGSDMGMNEDTQVSMDTSDGDGGESAAASEIPERADEEGTEVNTSQQCGMAAAVKEGEECQEVKMSDLEGSVGEFKLNIVTCVKEEPGDDLAAVAEEGCSEPSGSEEPAALGAEALSSPRAHGQHQAHAAVEENEDALKPFESLHQEPVQSYRASSNFLQQTLTEFKMEVSQNLQRNDTVLQQHRQHLAHVSVEKNEDDLKPLESLHLERVQSSEIYQATSKFLQQALTEFKMEVSQNLQKNREILQQQNEVLCQLLQRSNETLNEMKQILSRTVAPAPSGQQQPNAETSAPGHASRRGDITSRGWGRRRRK